MAYIPGAGEMQVMSADTAKYTKKRAAGMKAIVRAEVLGEAAVSRFHEALGGSRRRDSKGRYK